MGNMENLKRGEATRFKSGSEAARINGRLGGLASGETRKIRSAAAKLAGLCPELTEKQLEQYARFGLDAGKVKLDVRTIMLMSLVRQGIQGDMDAVDRFFKYAGYLDEKVLVELLKIETAQADAAPDSEAVKIIRGYDGGVEVDDGT